MILKFFNKDNKIKINEVDSSFFKTSYFAKRPFSERLINKKLNSIKLNKMRHWRIALKHYLNNICSILNFFNYLEYHMSNLQTVR